MRNRISTIYAKLRIYRGTTKRGLKKEEEAGWLSDCVSPDQDQWDADASRQAHRQRTAGIWNGL